MTIISGVGARLRGLFSDIKGPWGPSSGGPASGDGSEPQSGGGPDEPAKGPWGEPQGRRKRSTGAPLGNVTSLDDLLRKSRARFGRGGDGPGKDYGSLVGWAILALVLLWLLFTTFHRISPEERGVVTRFGRYSHTLNPGISLTLPWPVDRVQKVDVENIRTVDLGTGPDTLMLTGDQNIIDIAYSVRWNIRDPELYLFELREPEDTIQQVAESAMRAVISRVSLDDAMGERRGEIENEVQETMQRILNGYRAGVVIQGVAVKQADPPAAVNEAFKEVTAAQQDAESYINQANAYATQLIQKAQGEAAAFDKVYEEYKLAPEVTRRRMYYETMERVLQNVDKTIVETPGVTPYLPLPSVTRPQGRGGAQ